MCQTDPNHWLRLPWLERGQLGIGGVEVDFRQPEADGRLAICFVHGINLLVRLGFDPGLEAYRVARGRVEGIPHAPDASELSITLYHILHLHFVRI